MSSIIFYNISWNFCNVPSRLAHILEVSCIQIFFQTWLVLFLWWESRFFSDWVEKVQWHLSMAYLSAIWHVLLISYWWKFCRTRFVPFPCKWERLFFDRVRYDIASACMRFSPFWGFFLAKVWLSISYNGKSFLSWSRSKFLLECIHFWHFFLGFIYFKSNSFRRVMGKSDLL